MYCPHCRREEAAEAAVCPVCGAALLAAAPVFDRGALDLVRLEGPLGHIESEMLCELLRRNGIPCLAKERYSGQYMTLYMGFSAFGEEIFVNRRDETRARELLDELQMLWLDDPPEQPYVLPFYRNARVVITLILVLFVLAIVVAIFR